MMAAFDKEKRNMEVAQGRSCTTLNSALSCVGSKKRRGCGGAKNELKQASGHTYTPLMQHTHMYLLGAYPLALCCSVHCSFEPVLHETWKALLESVLEWKCPQRPALRLL